jgi:hypothetical protein
MPQHNGRSNDTTGLPPEYQRAASRLKNVWGIVVFGEVNAGLDAYVRLDPHLAESTLGMQVQLKMVEADLRHLQEYIRTCIPAAQLPQFDEDVATISRESYRGYGTIRHDESDVAA